MHRRFLISNARQLSTFNRNLVRHMSRIEVILPPDNPEKNDRVRKYLRKVYGTMAIGSTIGVTSTLTFLLNCPPSFFMYGAMMIGTIGPIVSYYAMRKLKNKNDERANFYRHVAYGTFCASTGIAVSVIAGLYQHVIDLMPMILMRLTPMIGTSAYMYYKGENTLTEKGVVAGMATGFVGYAIPYYLLYINPLNQHFDMCLEELVYNPVFLTLLVARSVITMYDCNKMIESYKNGNSDHLDHATNLFLTFETLIGRIIKLFTDKKLFS